MVYIRSCGTQFLRLALAGLLLGVLCGHVAAAVNAVKPVQAGTPIDVYLVAGQSNMTGQGYMSNLPKNFQINTHVLLYHSAGNIRDNAPANTWVPLEQASESPDRFGPELSFGDRMQLFYSRHHIALIKDAWSGTDLARNWNPGANAQDTAHWGPQFREFVNTVTGGLMALRRLGYAPRIRGMIWQQGENDAFEGLRVAEEYGANLRHFIHRVRQQFQCPNLPFVYGMVLPPPNLGLFHINPRSRALVRMAQRDVAWNSGSPLAVRGAYLVHTNDLEQRAEDPHTPLPTDHLHFGTIGQLDLGRLMADTMYCHLHLLPVPLKRPAYGSRR